LILDQARAILAIADRLEAPDTEGNNIWSNLRAVIEVDQFPPGAITRMRETRNRIPVFSGELREESQNRYLSFIKVVKQYVNELLQAAGKTQSFSYGRVEERKHPTTLVQLIRTQHHSALAFTALYMAFRNRTQQAEEIMGSIINMVASIVRGQTDPIVW
jgi:hypothetical protein